MSAERMRPNLDDVTLLAVTSVALQATVEALETSMAQANFGRVLLLSDKPPPRLSDTAIEWRTIPAIRSRSDYSRFMLRDLAEHVQTTHALCVQWDGFVLDGGAWDPEFAEYDYIGAVWPQFTDGNNVGNGGFSLRSRRLLDACASLPFEGSDQEDIVIARTCRQMLEQRGLRFAPEQLARRFAFERSRPTRGEFGFHGAFNLVRHIEPAKAVALFRSLEPEILTRSEHLELLRWALSRGRFALAAEILFRLHSRRTMVS